MGKQEPMKKSDKKNGKKNKNLWLFWDIYKLRKVDFYFFRCWMFDEKKKFKRVNSRVVAEMINGKILPDSDSIC